MVKLISGTVIKSLVEKNILGVTLPIGTRYIVNMDMGSYLYVNGVGIVEGCTCLLHPGEYEIIEE